MKKCPNYVRGDFFKKMVKTLQKGPKKSKKSPLTLLGHFLKIVFGSPKMLFLGFEPTFWGFKPVLLAKKLQT